MSSSLTSHVNFATQQNGKEEKKKEKPGYTKALLVVVLEFKKFFF